MIHFSSDIQRQLAHFLEQAIQFEEADMGNIQLFDPEKKVLEIVAHKGFKSDFLTHFKEVKAFDTSVCGRAMGMGAPLIVGDVTLDESFAPHRAIAQSAGFRSVKSVPIVTADHLFIGMISFHCHRPRWSWNILQPRQLYSLAEVLRPFMNN